MFYYVARFRVGDPLALMFLYARLSIKVTVIRGAWVEGLISTTNGVYNYILLESTLVGPNMGITTAKTFYVFFFIVFSHE